MDIRYPAQLELSAAIHRALRDSIARKELAPLLPRCDEGTLIWLLTLQFAGWPTSHSLEPEFISTKLHDRDFVERVKKLVAQADALADGIRQLRTSHPSGWRINSDFKVEGAPFDVILEDYSVYLQVIALQLKLTTLNRAYGHNVPLGLLATYVWQRTGRTHYGHLAELLNFAEQAWDKVKRVQRAKSGSNFNQVMLSKRVATFRRIHADEMRAIEAAVAELPPRLPSQQPKVA